MLDSLKNSPSISQRKRDIKITTLYNKETVAPNWIVDITLLIKTNFPH